MILITGGSGRLGKELQKLLTDFWAPTHEKFDITHKILGFPINPFNIQLIVHCAAYTDVANAETQKKLCYETNVLGTRNLASLGIPMLYISTEYVFDGERGNYSEEDYPNPQNFYALTKLLGEYEARKTRSVVVRCLFKPRPFEHHAACVDQFTSGMYVDDMAKEIANAIKKFNFLPPTIHIGGQRISTYELASKTKEVIPITIKSIGAVKLPKDTSLNSKLWERLK